MAGGSPLISVVGRFTSVRAGVLGDLMADRFIYGDALRISPEAPVPVVRVRRQTIQAGGAANVARNVLSMGGAVSLFGVLGNDEEGNEVLANLEEAAARSGPQEPYPGLAGVLQPPGYRTTVKTRVVAGSQHLLRFDEEDTSPIAAASRETIIEQLASQIESLQVLAVSDYAKGVIGRELAERVFALCREAGTEVIVDPKPANLDCFAGAGVIKPNLGEALRIAGMEAETPQSQMEEV
ncbi:hypothetical protein IIA79_08235, partial [bacterium]|nr:hypothetical protein [bacterium]